MHLVGDVDRGYLIELLLTTLRMAGSKGLHTMQLVTMSATVPNTDDLAAWMDAALYVTDYRCVGWAQVLVMAWVMGRECI